jgi:hypothetical protein
MSMTGTGGHETTGTTKLFLSRKRLKSLSKGGGGMLSKELLGDSVEAQESLYLLFDLEVRLFCE